MGCRISKPGLQQQWQQMNFWPLNRPMEEITINEGAEGKRVLGQESNGLEKGPRKSTKVALSNVDVVRTLEEREKNMEVCGESEEESSLGYAAMPASPSFRIYYRGSVNDSRRIDKGRSNEKSDVLFNEGLEFKLAKKEKGRRLRALAKRHIAVYRFLNVRSCCHPSHDDHRKMLVGKAS